MRLAEDLAMVTNPLAKANGITLGQHVASTIITDRADDGVQTPEPLVNIDHITSNQPGHWRQDPISLIPLALGAHWGECRTFVIKENDIDNKYRVSPPPALTSAAYATAYNEVKRLGGDGSPRAHRTHSGADLHRHLLGLRWNAKPLRAAAFV